jgi:stearoyl-CoA desaturase (delta-9 desaturase)
MPLSQSTSTTVTVTAVIVALPFVALGLLGRLLWGSLIHPADIVLAAVL